MRRRDDLKGAKNTSCGQVWAKYGPSTGQRRGKEMSRGRKGRGGEGGRDGRSFSGNEGTEGVNWAELAELVMVY